MSRIATVLNEAADLIETGWTQGTSYEEGCFCADGALQVASGFGFIDEDNELANHDYCVGPSTNLTDEYKTYTAAYNAACATAAKTEYGMPSIIGFNDDHAESAADVVAVLRKAAAEAAA